MMLYDSFTSWFYTLLSCMGGCFGRCSKAKRKSNVNEPAKEEKCKGQVVEKHSLSDDFWGTSTCDVDNGVDQSRRSLSSISTSTKSFNYDVNSATANSHNEFVNHGLILWNQIRLQWTAVKSLKQSRPARGPGISLNATYQSLLGTKARFRQPIPLSEMVEFLVEVWEQEGLCD